MIDIEELTADASMQQSASHIVPRKTYNSSKIQDNAFLPGQGIIFVKTWGCGHNNSDGEYMAGILADHGYEIILQDDQKDKAHLWLLNSCTVKGPSEQTFINEIQKAMQNGKKIVVSGCVPQGAPKGSAWNQLSIIGVQQIDKVVYVVEETLKGNTVQLLKEVKKVDKLSGKSKKVGGADLMLPKIRRNQFIEIIPINTGCLNQCTYCKTKHARGDLGSYTIQEIITRVDAVLSEGVMEIWLTSEDTGAYGRDIGVNIILLLNQIVQTMANHENQGAMLRIGMTNPPYILEHLPAMVPILNHPRVYSFLHVPFQAGSNRVLNDMRRLYVKEDFTHVVEYLRQHVADITIATDVICGFPTETDLDFEETIDLIRIYKFPALHISQFYPRPGTPAARLQKLPSETVKSRSRQATKLFDSYRCYDHLIGEKLDVLVTDRAQDSIHYVAHDKCYRPILVPAREEYMGKWVNVTVLETGKYFIKTIVNSILPNQSEGTIKIPKLIRGQKGMVRLKNDSDITEGDGTHLSIPTVPTARSEQYSSLINYITLSAPAFFGILTSILPIRWSLKFGIFATMMTALYKYPKSK